MRVPFLDLTAANAEVAAELDGAFAAVRASGRWILGEQLAAFEREWAARCATAHCVGVGSGLDALALALRAAGIGPGDEVVVPAQTFVATWLAVSAAGATPVGADVDHATGTLDPRAAAAAVGPRTAAIVPVHLFGQPADMTALRALADDRGLFLLEDAAQAHGASWAGRPAGALGDAAAFSFYPGKNLGALGDAGAVTTGDAALAERIRLLRNYGSPERYVHEIAGGNTRLDELQAAFLRAKLPLLDRWNARRRAVAARYADGLGACEGLAIPAVAAPAAPSWHLFAIRSHARDALAQHLAAAGIETLVHYPTPPHRTGAYDLPDPFREAQAWADEELSLPIGPHLAPAQVDAVVAAVAAFRPPARRPGQSSAPPRVRSAAMPPAVEPSRPASAPPCSARHAATTSSG